MTLDEFWDHIEKTRCEDSEEHAERLEKRLAKLPPDEILDSIRWWETMSCEAYDWNLWGAAYLINGMSSDDGWFYSFRDWVIIKGREIFQAAVTNPDTLAEVVNPDGDGVGWVDSPAARAWFTATKTLPYTAGYAALQAAQVARHGAVPLLPTLRDQWDHTDDSEMRLRFPRLAALYLKGADGE